MDPKRATARLTRLMFCLAFALARPADAAEALRLATPPEMVESGFLKYILPRFKLKFRIAVEPVAPGDASDMTLAEGGGGPPVFADEAGLAYHLAVPSGHPEAEKFLAWVQSAPGRAAIESFPRGGPPLYTTNLPEPEAEAEPELTGDAALGSKLALMHCGRCHVVDQRNRMGGIGSTPSFPALRARRAWYEQFSKYFTMNPHPSFTHIVDVTEPFSDQRPTHVAPVQLTLTDLEAILAFVATIPPKDLGQPIRAN